MESSATHTLSTQTQGAPLAKYAASRRVVGGCVFREGSAVFLVQSAGVSDGTVSTTFGTPLAADIRCQWE